GPERDVHDSVRAEPPSARSSARSHPRRPGLSIRGRNYRLGFDTGGTFTDFALFDESTGSLHVHKVLSTPQDPALAVIKGVRDLLERVDIHPGRDHLTIYGATTVVT